MKAINALFFNGQKQIYGRQYEEICRGKFDDASLEKLNDEFEVEYDEFNKLAIRITLKPSPITGFVETLCFLEVERDDDFFTLGTKVRKEDIIVLTIREKSPEIRNSNPKTSYKLTHRESDNMVPMRLNCIPHWEVTKEQVFTDTELLEDGLKYSTRISPAGVPEVVVSSMYGNVSYQIYGDLRDTFGELDSLDVTKYNVALITRKYCALPNKLIEFKKKSTQKVGDPFTRMGIYLSLK